MDQMAWADRFVYLDDVQFTRRDWRNRNRIRTSEGSSWLTVPVLQKKRFEQSLRDTRIDNSVSWRSKHCESLRHHYRKAPYFDLYFPRFESIYNKEWEFLVDLCYESLDYLRSALGIDTPTQKSSDLNAGGAKGDKIIRICDALEATHYLTGDKSADYLDPQVFIEHQVELEYHGYKHPEYIQQYPGFVPYLSVVDLMFNHGDRSLDVLRQGRSSGPE